jgi:hypothetical protein
MKLQIMCDWVIKNRQWQLADWALAEEIAKEYGNFFIGRYDAKNLRRARKMLSLDNIKKLFDLVKACKDIY